MDRKPLKDYKYNKKYVEEIMQDIETRKELINKLTATYGGNGNFKTNINDKIAEDLAILLDMTTDYEKIIKKMKEDLMVIEKAIEELAPEYRNILYRVYIKGEPLVNIASDLGYSYRQMCRKHGIALKKYDKL